MAEFVVETGRGEAGVLAVSGELDIATVDQFLAQARAALEAASGVLVVDFGGVTFVDSTGLSSLVRLRNEARRNGKDVDLVRVRQEVRRVLDVTGLSELFPDKTDD